MTAPTLIIEREAKRLSDTTGLSSARVDSMQGGEKWHFRPRLDRSSGPAVELIPQFLDSMSTSLSEQKQKGPGVEQPSPLMWRACAYRYRVQSVTDVV